MSALLLSLLVAPALAQDDGDVFPIDIDLEGMMEHDGQLMGGIDTDTLAADYLQLMAELGTAIAPKPMEPVRTLGSSGFDMTLSTTFVFITNSTDDNSPTPWERANANETQPQFVFVPQVSMRKGLPLSLEIGGSAGWLGMSRNGVFGGWGRLAIVEGYKPLPDVAVKVGYSGYVGNDQLEMGVLDVGIALGSTFAFGSFPGINQATFSPWFSYNVLTMSAFPLINADIAADVGAVELSTDADSENAVVVNQFSGGFEIANGAVHFRLGGSWAIGGVPHATVGIGFSY